VTRFTHALGLNYNLSDLIMVFVTRGVTPPLSGGSRGARLLLRATVAEAQDSFERWWLVGAQLTVAGEG
jgi:hypothetical protein